MIDQSIELWSLHFWMTGLTGFVLLYATRNVPVWHKRFWAMTNVGFLTAMFGEETIWILLFIITSQAGLYAFRVIPNRATISVCAISVFSVLFLFYRLPAFVPEDFQTRINPLLQLIGYSYIYLRLVDQYREMAESDESPPDLLSSINYLIPFHMLAAGPIQSWQDYRHQSSVQAPFTLPQILDACQLIVHGLFKKYVLAGIIQEFLLTGYQTSGIYLIIEIQLAFIWLYLDFSAYTNIAQGIGRLLCVHTPNNFNRPWMARNLIDFWERWHISLSQWIRRNLFLPLQHTMMRKTRGRHTLLIASGAFLVSFLLCGFWHGTGLNFILWGFMHAVGLICVNLYRHMLKKFLGAAGVRQYMANSIVRIVATVMTFEYVAFSLVPVFGVN